ncbi:class I SAM-dependent methyltransferase [Francisella sp. 19X1-34]|uniref:class I SAM-dependent methyltransferase n=1 Tax=Francisella sp. 19X1-34 TaxID=3087177 RepID=UPI002E315938|nr:class I SAM-dependent methyltransferase [Francisella sp. 19X1-34]MED7787861.1 class I SAM-dependent methyltransferase [Francisella sp. 19X1-34]
MNLNGVPETMLLTLYHRAYEAAKKNGVIKDELCLKIFNKINYDYYKSFGKPSSALAIRAKTFDDYIELWIAQNPNCPIVEVGVGLETSYFRINNPSVKWYVVDLPEAIKFRERYIPKKDNLFNIAKSALDYSWLEVLEDTDKRICFSFQGLLMYFEESQVIELLQCITTKFPNATLIFDTAPVWISKKTIKGWKKTESYTFPKMPWGININDITKEVPQWLPGFKISFLKYKMRGFKGIIYTVLSNFPFLKNLFPAIVCVSKSTN